MLDLLILDFEFLEYLVDRQAYYFLSGLLMELFEILGSDHFIVVNDVIFPPILHDLMPAHHNFDIIFYKILLIALIHVINYVLHVKGRTNQTQRLYVSC